MDEPNWAEDEDRDARAAQNFFARLYLDWQLPDHAIEGYHQKLLGINVG